MDPENEQTLRNLGILAAVSQNDKLNTKDDTFTIYVPTTWRAMTRFIYGEGREHNIMKIQACIRNAKKYIETNLNEIHNLEDSNPSFVKTITVSTQTQLCNRMIESLQGSLNGLMALMSTYKDDATATTKLTMMINEIQDFLNVTQRVTKASPVLERFK